MLTQSLSLSADVGDPTRLSVKVEGSPFSAHPDDNFGWQRGADAAFAGWRLGEGMAGPCSSREYTPYHLRSVLQLMGLKQLRQEPYS